MKFKKPSLPTNYKSKIKLSPKILAIAAIVVVIIGAAIAGYIYNKNHNTKSVSVDCNQLVIDTTAMLINNKNQEAYDKLKPFDSNCGRTPNEADVKDPAKTAQTLNIMQYDGNAARAAYLSGDKSQAKVYAQRTLDISKNLSQKQRDQLPDRTGFFFDMNDILQGEYQVYPIQRKQKK